MLIFDEDETTIEDEIIQKAIFGKIPKDIVCDLKKDGYVESEE